MLTTPSLRQVYDGHFWTTNTETTQQSAVICSLMFNTNNLFSIKDIPTTLVWCCAWSLRAKSRCTVMNVQTFAIIKANFYQNNKCFITERWINQPGDNQRFPNFNFSSNTFIQDTKCFSCQHSKCFSGIKLAYKNKVLRCHVTLL